MKNKKQAWRKTTLIALIVFSIAINSQAQNMVKLGAKPGLFAPGIISTENGEFAPTFSPDGKTVYFTGGPAHTMYIYRSQKIAGRWTKPEIMSFSGKWKDMDPFLSPDGKRLFFSSYRPDRDTSNTQLKFAHIWYVELTGGKWSSPYHLDSPVNLAGISNYAPAVSGNGTLYFYSPNRDLNNRSTYSSEWIDGHYETPVLVPIEGDGGVHDPYISPTQHYLIFASGGNLYISFQKNSHWSDRQKLGDQVNDGGKNSSPCVSPDGKTLYYSSDKANGILMVSIEVI